MWVATAGLLVSAMLLTGCSASDPDPAPAATELAAALTAGDVTTLALTDTPPAQAQSELDEATGGMSPATVAVAVVETTLVDEGTQDTPRADATLGVSWDLDGDAPASDTWEYETTASLELVESADAAQWQVDWSTTLVHPSLAPGSALSRQRVGADRGDVLGSGGAVLVTERPVARAGIDKVRLDGVDADEAARELAAIVGVNPDEYADTVAAAGPEAFVEAIVLREPDAQAVRAAVEAVPGGRMLADEAPLAPTREFARALLGTVGAATAEIVDASDGEVAAGDLVGLSGLQATYDAQLRGTAGSSVSLVRGGEVDEVLHTVPATDGQALATTLDPVIQQIADGLLASVEPPSALVALRPSDGQLVAVASGPGSGGYSTATVGQYAPGSVFKVATSLALLRAGVSPDSLLPCPPTVTVDGKVFRNYTDYPPEALGDITLTRAFAASCNTAFVSQRDVVDASGLAQAATSLGVGSTTDVGFEAFLGSVGAPESQVDLAASLIGQGSVLMSPLSAATMVASTVAGPVTPRLLLDAPGAAPTSSPSGAEESAALTELMRAAVTDGTAEVLRALPGPPVGAKTGTAEFGAQTPPATHGWMVAVQGDLAVAVFVEEAESGSATAGPIMADFLSQAQVPPATS